MAETPIVVRPTHTRHVVLALIVTAYMITYMDRVNIASAVPVIQKDMGFSMITIGWIFVVARQISARSSQWKSPRNFRLHDGSRNTDCQTVLRKQQIEFQCGGELLDLGISTPFF